MKTEYTVIIIGSGFGGQCSAINLLKRKIDDFVMLERRDFMGGTWAQNSYPGAAVDVQSPLYSLSFEPYQWTQMFAAQAELQTYTNFVIDKYKLRDKTLTNHNVDKLAWNEDSKRWVIETSQGTYTAQFVVNASGPLSTPVIPPFKGIDTFTGKTFHTNNWDNSYSLKGKKVAIVGSGASAAQVIPAIVNDVAELHVFQRTPHWVLPRPDYVFSPLQRKLLGVKALHKALRTIIYWSLESRVIAFKYSKKALNVFAQQKAVRYLEKSITDPAMRAKLTPDYTIGCKRVILSSTLYPALCHANTTLHDKTQGIAEITPTGITTQDGQNLELDLIVWSTGYDATDGVISYPVVGKAGVKLADVWAQYPRAYLGTAMPSFPNLFVVTGPNTGIGHTSAIFVIEAQMHYIMDSISKTLAANKASIEVTAVAESDYTAMIHQEMKKTVWDHGGCNSWYKSKSGHVIAMFPGFSFTYLGLAKRFKMTDHIFQ